MKDMFSIGELAGYQNISKQTLIFYDKIGLFQPAYVDPSNKYRYYTAQQIDYLDTILIMKELGFSLSEIQEHMKNYTIDTSLVILRKAAFRHRPANQTPAAGSAPASASLRTDGARKRIPRGQSGGDRKGQSPQRPYPLRPGGRSAVLPGNQHRHEEVFFSGAAR